MRQKEREREEGEGGGEGEIDRSGGRAKTMVSVDDEWLEINMGWLG